MLKRLWVGFILVNSKELGRNQNMLTSRPSPVPKIKPENPGRFKKCLELLMKWTQSLKTTTKEINEWCGPWW
jgi:hypothetical protein